MITWEKLLVLRGIRSPKHKKKYEHLTNNTKLEKLCHVPVN